ncbi:hypothetical protein BgiBS90_023419, partial [Biomphalaria glabrata]
DLEDFEYFENKAQELPLPENERYEWINKQVEMNTQKRIAELELKKLELQRKIKDRKRANQTTESQSP